MKACERYLNAINELVDGTLGPIRRAELDMHLEGCEGCRALVSDLRQIAETAQGLETLPPPDHVWKRIAGRLEAEGRIAPARRWTYHRSYPMLALAAVLLIAVGASLVMVIPRSRNAPEPTQTARQGADANGAQNPEDPVQTVASELTLTEHHFQNAIESATRSDALVDAETAAVLQKNLLVVNQAIAESRAALTADPESAPARQSLYDALRQKIQFLQDTIALMNVMRQGDAAGAAEIVEGGKS